jgi:hypothetical protein
MRWKPTRRALGMIQDGEYSELSIAFAPVKHNVTGADQGEVLLSVALTNLPFLDDMLPVAASLRGDRRTPAGSATHHEESPMTQKALTVLSAVAALIAKPVADDEQAVTELTALQPEILRTREYTTTLAAEIGETDPAKAVAKVKELKALVATHEATAKTAKAAQIKTTVEATLVKHEKRLTKPSRDYFATQLTRELEAGAAKIEDTDTFKVLSGLPELGITSRATGADDGSSSANTGDDKKLDAKAKELMNSNAEIKALHERVGFGPAFSRALTMAAEELGIPAKATLQVV